MAACPLYHAQALANVRLFATVLMAAVIVVTFNMKAIYEPVARIEVDPPGEQFSLEGAGLG